MPGHTSSNVTPLHEFCTLSMLLATVTTINRGQPSEQPQPASEKYRGSSEWSSKPSNLALHVIATLLVRESEIVAVVGHDSQQVFAVQNEEPKVHEQESNSNTQTWFSKAYSIVTNPNREELNQHFPEDQESQCVIAEAGRSHYNLISNSNWDCLTIE